MVALDTGLVTVEIQRNRAGCNEEESAAFHTVEEAREWADCMRENFGYRKIWINGIEYSGKGK